MQVVNLIFWSFVLPLLNYCSLDWSSAAASHLSLLDRVIRRAVALNEFEVVKLSVIFRIGDVLPLCACFIRSSIMLVTLLDSITHLSQYLLRLLIVLL